MAVKIHEYFAHYKRDALALFALASLFSGVLAAGSTYLLWEWLNPNPIMTVCIGSALLVICNVLIGLLIFKVSSEPLRILTQAIAHVSKDPVVTPPPDLAAKRFESSGLRAMVQTVYELAVASGQTQRVEGSSQVTFAEAILAELPCGVIALKDNKVIFANKLAPVTQKSDGQFAMSLIFDQRDNFDIWLNSATANKVRDTHFWMRVPNKLPGESGQQIFDIAAYYQKEASVPFDTLLVAFDRTAVYEPDQEDMDFIALAAHELRGPITVIRGYLDVLHQELGQTLSDEQKQLLDRLQVSSERLSSYVNNILNVSRYDRHQFKVHLYEENLLDIMKNLVPDLALRATTQNRTLKFQIPQNLPSVAADRSSLSEVITNLVDNAIKYSYDAGDVVIAAATKGDMVEVTVTDTGIGMPGSVMGSLFNRFYRSHRSRQQVGGTGLGLYICKAIVEAHGGSIWVRSAEGQGSTFGFTLPTYASVADKLKEGDNLDIIQRSDGWIKNHAMYRR